MKGFGTVVAGTVLSGTLAIDQTVELLPQRQRLRVRGLQIHEQNVTSVKTGDRAAVNLVGIEKEAISRGDVLVAPDSFRPTRYFDGKFHLLENVPRGLSHTDRIRLNIGASEVIGRVSILDKDEIEPGESAYIQFRLDKPIVPDIGDRYVVRTYSPIFSIGGGVVLDVNPKRHKRFSEDVLQKVSVLEQGDIETIVEQLLLHHKYQPTTLKPIAQQVSLPAEQAQEILQSLEKKKRCFRFTEKGQDYFIHYDFQAQLKDKIQDSLSRYHNQNPTRRGISKTDLKVLIDLPVETLLFNKALEEMVQENKLVVADNRVALATHQLLVSERQQKLMDRIAKIYYEAGFTTPDIFNIAERIGVSESDVMDILKILFETEVLIKAEESIIFHQKRVDEAIQLIKAHFNHQHQLTVGDFREMIASSRKYAVPLLSHFDSIGLTIRQHDVRVINPDFKK
jgi:selenocysteine-specific elongation factor